MKRFICLFGVLIGCLIMTTSSFAQLKFSTDYCLRLRNEFWKNWKDMNNDTLDNRNFFRIKASVGGKIQYNEEATLYARLTDEFRPFTYFAGTSAAYPDKTASKKGYRFDINEVVFDNLYLDVNKFAGAPLDLRVGRQDLYYGEGFLIADGTPQDGSRTYYFNAVKASWKIDDANTLDMIYINDPRSDDFLPVINRTAIPSASKPTLDKAPQALNVTDETGGILYLKNKAFKDTYLEAYYMFKKESEEGGVGYQSQKCLLNTFGSYVKYDFSPYTVRAQAAYQVGEYGDEGREGYGGYGYLDRSFKDFLWSPRASIGYIYLSGDNRSTSKNESWDPLFSRYPWISELYLLSLASETSITSYWTNIQTERAVLYMFPTKKTKLSLSYNYMRANAQVAASSIFSGTSKSRGQLFQTRIDYAVSKNISTYFTAEYFKPGKFYTHQSEALFLRTEVMFKF